MCSAHAGWAGGSYLSAEDLWRSTQSSADKQQKQLQQLQATAAAGQGPPAWSVARKLTTGEVKGGSSSSRAQVAFVTYKGASHCTVSRPERN
jgi:hypothetical protein